MDKAIITRTNNKTHPWSIEIDGEQIAISPSRRWAEQIADALNERLSCEPNWQGLGCDPNL